MKPFLIITSLFFGLINHLFADCSDAEIKELISKEVRALKRKGFYDFKDLFCCDNFMDKIYFFTAKKQGHYGLEVYGGKLIVNVKDCGELKDWNLEKLKPINISDFKNEHINPTEGCTRRRVKNIIYENLYHSQDWVYPYGTLLKGWGFHQFIYTAGNPDYRTGKIEQEYLGIMEISKLNCSTKTNELAGVRVNQP